MMDFFQSMFKTMKVVSPGAVADMGKCDFITGCNLTQSQFVSGKNGECTHSDCRSQKVPAADAISFPFLIVLNLMACVIHRTPLFVTLHDPSSFQLFKLDIFSTNYLKR